MLIAMVTSVVMWENIGKTYLLVSLTHQLGFFALIISTVFQTAAYYRSCKQNRERTPPRTDIDLNISYVVFDQVIDWQKDEKIWSGDKAVWLWTGETSFWLENYRRIDTCRLFLVQQWARISELLIRND